MSHGQLLIFDAAHLCLRGMASCNARALALQQYLVWPFTCLIKLWASQSLLF